MTSDIIPLADGTNLLLNQSVSSFTPRGMHHFSEYYGTFFRALYTLFQVRRHPLATTPTRTHGLSARPAYLRTYPLTHLPTYALTFILRTDVLTYLLTHGLSAWIVQLGSARLGLTRLDS